MKKCVDKNNAIQQNKCQPQKDGNAFGFTPIGVAAFIAGLDRELFFTGFNGIGFNGTGLPQNRRQSRHTGNEFKRVVDSDAQWTPVGGRLLAFSPVEDRISHPWIASVKAMREHFLMLSFLNSDLIEKRLNKCAPYMCVDH
jgi:hypothetical protein